MPKSASKRTAMLFDKKLLSQFLIVFAAFSLMIVISDYFSTDIVNKHVSSYGGEVVSASAEAIDSYLTGFCITLEYVSVFIERIHSDGADTVRMQNEIGKWSDLIQMQNRFGTLINIYGYINDAFIESNGWLKENADFEPKSRPWYNGAYEHNGGIFFSDPYTDARTGRDILTVSKLLFDEDNEPFGVVAIDVFITNIADYVNNMEFLGDGYGILLDSNRRYVVVPEDDFIGGSLEPDNYGSGGAAEMLALLAAGENLTAYNYTRYNGEPGVAFFRQLFNGWYIGFVSPREVYYSEVYFTRVVMSAAGLVSAILLCALLAYMHIRVKRLDEESRIKSSFLARMSHEMRTPMNIILGMSEYLQHEPLTERQMNYVSDINSSAGSFLSLIDDLLDMSKIETGKVSHSEADAPAEKPQQKQKLSAASANILVVDDNEINLKTVEALLGLLNIIPKTASSGKEAIDLVKKEYFDIIFMDHMMPEMDGVETTRNIRAWEKEQKNITSGKGKGLRKRIPITALTANTVEGVREMFLANGFDGYISKPINMDELKKILVKWLPAEKVKLIDQTPASNAEKSNKIELDTEFQKNIKSLFLKNNQNLFADFTKALQENNIELAHRLAHNLKSSAAQFGKTALRNIAADIERRFKDGKNTVEEERLKILEKELDTVLKEFALLLEEDRHKTVTPALPLDRETAQELIEKLEPLLEMGSPNSLKLIDSIRRLPESEKLIQQIENFYFEPALVTLTGLKKRLLAQ